MNQRALTLILLICIAVIAGIEPAAAQCAMCKSALVNSAEGQRIAQGINNGILFLLAAPFVTFGTIGLLVVRARRRWAMNQQ